MRGLRILARLRTHDQSKWRRVMETNLDGVFYMTQALTPMLKETQGAILNIASISGLRASTLRVAYGTSKAAVAHLTKQQACELGEYGIRVNCVAPGPVKTKLSIAVHTPEIIQAYHDAVPLNRYGSERELAEVIYFLCSPKASYVTGQVVAVDGGFEATGVGLPACVIDALAHALTVDVNAAVGTHLNLGCQFVFTRGHKPHAQSHADRHQLIRL